MSEQPNARSPFRKVEFGPIPADHYMLNQDGWEDAIGTFWANMRRAIETPQPPDAPIPTAEKITAYVQVPGELLDQPIRLGQPLIIGQPYTPEELAEIRYKHEVEWRAVKADYEATVDACVGQPGALAALKLHRPKDEYSIECEVSEEDELPTDWPCSTYTTIKEAVR